MESVEIIDESAEDFDRRKFNIPGYIKRTFGMYSGEVVSARLAFDESLVSVILDHFGSETRLSELGGGRFAIDAEVSTSPVFLGWIFQFGAKAEIIAPECLRDAMREAAAKVLGAYS
jgi:predicted DNA-binding transcriptional regulator YafY